MNHRLLSLIVASLLLALTACAGLPTPARNR